MRKRKKQQRGENQRASVQKIWARPYRRPTNLMRKVNKTQRERETLSTHVRFLSLSCRVCFIPPFVISVSVCLFLFSSIISLFVFFVVFERGIFFHSFLSFLFLLLTYVFRWDYRFDRCVRERASAHGGAHERMDDESTGDVESGQASGRRVRLYNIPEMKKSD